MEGAGAIISLSLLFVLAGCDPGGSAEHREVAAHETAAIMNVGVINKAQVSYYKSASKYASSLSELCGSGKGVGAPFNVPEISKRVCRGETQGYLFTVVSSSPADSYTVNAKPKTPGSSGRRFFYSDQTMVIRQSESEPATANSPEVK